MIVRVISRPDKTLVQEEHHYIGELISEDDKTLTLGSGWGTMVFVKEYVEVVRCGF